MELGLDVELWRLEAAGAAACDLRWRTADELELELELELWAVSGTYRK